MAFSRAPVVLMQRVLLIALSVLLGCAAEEPFPSSDELDLLRGMYKLSHVPASPTNAFADHPGARALGAALFEDVRLSSCGVIACASCHAAPDYVIAVDRPSGCNGQVDRNAPTLLNVGFRRWLYWDGQKDSLWAHPTLPLSRTTELAADANLLRARLQEFYAADYAMVFGKEPAAEEDLHRVEANFGKALEAFLRTLVRVDSVFDDELRRFIAAAEEDILRGGEVQARREPHYLGFRTFVREGRCALCHRGHQLTDDDFHNLGIDEGGRTDLGRERGIELVLADPLNGSSLYSDDRQLGGSKLDRIPVDLPKEGARGAFKTPSLRNVALSAPYMHNGQFATLENVIDFYDRGGDEAGTFSGKRAETIEPLYLSEKQRRALIDLLEAMTGREP